SVSHLFALKARAVEGPREDARDARAGAAVAVDATGPHWPGPEECLPDSPGDCRGGLGGIDYVRAAAQPSFLPFSYIDRVHAEAGGFDDAAGGVADQQRCPCDDAQVIFARQRFEDLPCAAARQATDRVDNAFVAGI